MAKDKMKYFWIVPTAQRHNNGLFYHLDGDGPRRPRRLYADLACLKCMKMPEDLALARGIDPSFKLRLSGDISCTDDGVYVFSKKAQDFVSAGAWSGLQFAAIPNDERYVLAFPRIFAKLENPDEMLRYDRTCASCGRWQWVGFGPTAMRFSPPPSADTLFQPDVWLESGFSRTTTLMCSADIAASLKAAKKAKELTKFSLQDVTPRPLPKTQVIIAPPLTCIHCSGTGTCFCLRTGSTSSSACVRCNGSGICHVCAGIGKK